MIELYRAIIPENFLINDNHSQHYRVHQKKLELLTQQYKRIKHLQEKTPGDFVIPDASSVCEIYNKIITIRCEVWRCVNREFDPQNYTKVFKAPIDLLSSDGYFKNDSWKYVNGILYVGGGREVWKDRAFRYHNDGLPEELTPEWWKKHSQNYNDILIRVIIDHERKI